MSLYLLLFIGLGALGAGLATYAVIMLRQRRVALDRAISSDGAQVVVALPPGDALKRALLGLRGVLPSEWTASRKYQEKLIQAGFDGEMASLGFAATRLGVLLVSLVLAQVIFDAPTASRVLLVIAGTVVVAWFVPLIGLDLMVKSRRDRIRKSVPDALDLLVVCVEAGTSLDAAILRVAREMRLSCPPLSDELLVVNRRTNAGVPSDEALRGLAARTGLPELRALVGSMIQSQRWGTSIAQVLRVNAETLRRKRRQAAEQAAQKAPLKMVIPLVLFILPPLFAVIMGPGVIRIAALFKVN